MRVNERTSDTAPTGRRRWYPRARALPAAPAPLPLPARDLVTEVLGLPNRITLVRTMLAMGVAVVAYRTGSPVWLVLGYAAYWLGDSLDGGVARYRKEETVSGAVFDIVCDRACAFFLAGAFLASYPDVLGPLAIFLFQFGVLDTMLSLSFLLWPGIISPNYFYRVDRLIWRWNWSHPAKAVNTGAVVLSLVLGHRFGLMWLPYSVALLVTVAKLASLSRLVRILPRRPGAEPVI